MKHAFPQSNGLSTDEPGMTLRDYFAGQAIASFLPGTVCNDQYIFDMAKQAYRVADAMLEARKS